MCYFPIAVKKPGNDYFSYVSCGKCDECKTLEINKWTARLEIEMKKYGACYMITFTLNDYFYDFFGIKKHLKRYFQLLFKRLRKLGHIFKYYLVCEKGSLNGRIHAHAIYLTTQTELIKMWATLKEFYVDIPVPSKLRKHPKFVNEYVAYIDEHQLGYINVKPCNVGGIRYVLGYLKENPEFTLCSKGLGRMDIEEVEKFYIDNKFVHRYYIEKLREHDLKHYTIISNKKNLKNSHIEVKNYIHDRHNRAVRYALGQEKLALSKKMLYNLGKELR